MYGACRHKPRFYRYSLDFGGKSTDEPTGEKVQPDGSYPGSVLLECPILPRSRLTPVPEETVGDV